MNKKRQTERQIEARMKVCLLLAIATSQKNPEVSARWGAEADELEAKLKKLSEKTAKAEVK